jgi:cytoskeletal protein CcmA (bactofilin family)
MLPFLALLGLTLLWLLLPLLPALRELARPTDVAPLKVVDRSSGYVAYFARNFRQYLDRQMAALPAEALAGDYVGKLPDGTQFVRVHKSPQGLTHEVEAGTQNRLVVVDGSMTLQDDETFLMEVYARGPMIGGAGSVYRAIYADRELGLGERSTVLRWAHAGGTLGVGSHSVLRGRITSDHAVVLGGNVVFERIGAPRISVGTEHGTPPAAASSTQPFSLPAAARQVGDHYRVEGDLEIPGGVRVTASLVVAGTLTIGEGAVVEGSVKAHRDVELASWARVRGSVVARRRVMVGASAWIGGPVIAEERIRIGQRSVVGGPELPATVSAPVIELYAGATVYGQISAPLGARTF